MKEDPQLSFAGFPIVETKAVQAGDVFVIPPGATIVEARPQYHPTWGLITGVKFVRPPNPLLKGFP